MVLTLRIFPFITSSDAPKLSRAGLLLKPGDQCLNRVACLLVHVNLHDPIIPFRYGPCRNAPILPNWEDWSIGRLLNKVPNQCRSSQVGNVAACVKAMVYPTGPCILGQ